MSLSNIFIHHVFFWLRNPGSATDRAALIAGLKNLSKAATIKQFHIGEAAGTDRDVVETSYAVSWLLFFDSPADQESYQTDPIHLQFVREYSSLWSKVVVYDSVDADVPVT
jgi:hypothetical protein